MMLLEHVVVSHLQENATSNLVNVNNVGLHRGGSEEVERWGSRGRQQRLTICLNTLIFHSASRLQRSAGIF